MYDNKITLISLFKTGHCRGGCEKAPSALTSDRPFTTYQEPSEPKKLWPMTPLRQPPNWATFLNRR
jgi:hypothetical protein